MKALLIVDIQNDFLRRGALEVKEGDSIIPLINELQEKFDLVVASKDWHPKDHVSFASRHKKKVGETILWDNLPQILWSDHCVQGTPGAEFSPLLSTEKIEKVFFKGSDPNIDSYSAFFDNEHKRSTGLFEYLKSKQVTDIYLVGLTTDYCVKYSTLDALKCGFKVHVILEACKGVELHPGDTEKAISEMKKAGAHLVDQISLFL